MYKIQKREITLNDLLQVKEFAPFKRMRFTGKQINLSTLFAATGPTVGKSLRKAGFDEKDCDQTLDSLSLINAFNQAKNNPNNKLSDLDLKYTIIGNKLRELFFKSYPCLLKRVEREQKFAIDHGYVRTWTGPVRHLAELNYLDINKQGNLQGLDRKLYSKMFAHLKNEASNTTIQTAEVYQAAPNVTAINTLLRKWNFKSRVYNYVHDSYSLYVYKPEKDIIYALLNKLSQEHREPYYNLRMYIDVNEADLELGEYYDSGRDINIEKYNLEEELKKYNEKNGTNLEYKCLIPK